MNTKVANLIAVELGILIAIMAWLAFAQLSIVKPHAVAPRQEATPGSFATVAPTFKAKKQRLSAANYPADRAAAELGAEEQAQTVHKGAQICA
jgi:hypothetical protein